MKVYSFVSKIIFTLVVLALLSLPVAAVPIYTVEDLEGGVIATAINERGDAVGWANVPGGTQAFVYTDESGFVLLPSPPDRPFSLARDINDNGEIVGSAYIDTLDQPGHAVRWRLEGNGFEVTDLGTLEGDSVSEARGVNNQGQIVGYSNPNSFLSVRAFLYTDETGMVDLQAGGLAAYAHDINELGQVTGYSGLHAFRWADAGGTEILNEPAGFTYSTSFSINDAGQVTGSLISATGNIERIGRYTDNIGWEILGGLGQHNLGWGINNQGDVVGEGVARVSPAVRRGVIYTDEIGKLVYISDLIEPASGWGIFAAYDINDAGQIVGYGSNYLTGQGGAVRLTPTGVMQPPRAPSDLTAEPRPAPLCHVKNAIVLHWTDNSDNDMGFKIEKRPSGGTEFKEIFAAAPTGTSFTDTDVQPGATYEYRVRAYNIAGNSDYSNTASATAPVDPPDCEPPVVTFVNPADGRTVSGNVEVLIESTDNREVIFTRFYVDGVSKCDSYSNTLTCTWSTRKLAGGEHQLRATAVDAAGNVGQQYIYVNVQNSRGKGKK